MGEVVLTTEDRAWVDRQMALCRPLVAGRRPRRVTVGVAAVGLLAVAGCSIPAGYQTTTQHDLRGHVIHCTWRNIFHPTHGGYGYFTHDLVSGPDSCVY